MNKNNLTWHFAVFIGILLTGFGFLFNNDSKPYGIGLLSISFLSMIIYLFIANLKLFPKYYIYKANGKSRNKAKEIIESIFSEASREGGEIYTTHIFPFDKDYKNDLAIEKLKTYNSENQLTFERLLIVENRDVEDEWIQKIFTDFPASINTSIHLLNPYPLLINRFSKAVIPRLNLLLYKRDNKHYSVIGLDKLQILGLSEVNFSIVIRHSKVFELLKNYFQSITGYGGLLEAKTKEEYLNNNLAPLPKGVHGTINKVARIAEKQSDILYVGLFGSLAKYFIGYYKDPFKIDKEHDIDFVIICRPGSENKIIQEFKNELSENHYKLLWNVDEDNFYPWRAKNKINIDVEIFPTNSEFFIKKQLLSRSILRYFITIYSYQNKSLSEYIPIDNKPLSNAERFNFILNCRKGIADFQRFFEKNDFQNTDPRRTITQLIKNTVWGITGEFPLDYRIAIDYLDKEWSENLTNCSIKRIRNVIEKNSDQIKVDINASFKTNQDLIKDIKNYAQQGV